MKRRERKAFWIELFLAISKKLDINFDSLRSKDVDEFFFLFEHYQKLIDAEKEK